MLALTSWGFIHHAYALTPEQSIRIKQPLYPRVSPNGQWLAYAVDEADLQKNRAQRSLWLLPLAAPHRQLYVAPLCKQGGPPTWDKESRQLAFCLPTDRGPQLAVYSLGEQELTQKTHLPTGASHPQWAPQGGWVFLSRVYPQCYSLQCQKERTLAPQNLGAYAFEELYDLGYGTKNQGKVSHLYYLPANSSKPIDLTPFPYPEVASAKAQHAHFGFITDNTLVYTASLKKPDSNYRRGTALYTLKLNHPAPPVAFEASGKNALAPQGDITQKALAYLTQEGTGFSSEHTFLQYFDHSGKVQPLTEDLDLPVVDYALSLAQDQIHFVVEKRGHRALYQRKLSQKKASALIEEGSVEALHSAGGQTVIVYSRGSQTPEIYRLSKRRKLQPLTMLNQEVTEQLKLATWQEKWVEAEDGQKIQNYLLKAGKEDAPTIFMLHGGPEASWKDRWHPRWNPQLFSAAGYNVVLTNVRGSTGFGKAFASGARKDWGGPPYQDLMRVVEASKTWSGLGAQRCLVGASFGGFLVQWALSQSEQFACGISHAGISDPEGLWGQTDALQYAEHHFGGPPWKNPGLYQRFSPLKQSQKLTTPLLLTHGTEDLRVPVSQSRRMFTTLRRRGVPARLVLFPGEGHQLKRPLQRLRFQREMLSWLNRHLSPGASARFAPKGKQRQNTQLKVLQRKGQPNDGDGIAGSQANMGDEDPNARHQKPKDVQR